MNIARPAPTQFAEVTELWEASVRATHSFLSEQDIAALRPLVQHEFLPLVSLACVLGERGEVLGFVGVAEGKVEMLFVRPESFGQGVGKALLSHAVREMGARALDVNEQNPSALAFYQSQGFEVVGRSPLDAMGQPFPLLHMELTELRPTST